MTIYVEYRFDKATILVTGAGSGIGAALCAYCAAQGCDVIAVDIAHERLLDLMEDDAQRAHIDIQVVDISKDEQVESLFDHVRSKYDRLDAAVLGAAIQYRIDLADMTAKQWRAVIDVNLTGVFHCLRLAIPIFKEQRKGAIVTFTSGLALAGWVGASAYAASKAALIGMTKSVAHELRDFNVRANVLSPGVTATPIFLDAATRQERDWYEETIGVGTPDGVVPTLLYLISEASANLTGVVIEHRIRPAGASGILSSGDVALSIAVIIYYSEGGRVLKRRTRC